MIAFPANDTVHNALTLASRALEAGDAQGADRTLAPLLAEFGSDPRLLHMAGLVRMHQQRHEDAAELFARARAADPRSARLAFSHATALQWLERPDDALVALRDAIRLKPDYAEAYFEAGNTLRRLGRLKEAEDTFREWQRALPDDVQVSLGLGGVMLDAGRIEEAEAILAGALNEPASAAVKGALHHDYALALRRLNKNEEALAHFALAKELAPHLPLAT